MRRPWRRSYTTCAIEPLTGWNLGCRTISTVSLFRRVAKKSWQLLANASAATLRSPRLPRSRCSSSCRYDDPCVRPSSRPREGCNARCEKRTSTSTDVLQQLVIGSIGYHGNGEWPRMSLSNFPHYPTVQEQHVERRRSSARFPTRDAVMWAPSFA